VSTTETELLFAKILASSSALALASAASLAFLILAFSFKYISLALSADYTVKNESRPVNRI
jgi:hypothetical protein